MNQQLSNYDSGLALEDGRIDVNRNICLTNKIWSYLQSGLYILASDTDAQKEFIEQYNSHGVCTSLNNMDFKNALKYIIENKKFIREKRSVRYHEAQFSCWEIESEIFKTKWKQTKYAS